MPASTFEILDIRLEYGFDMINSMFELNQEVLLQNKSLSKFLGFLATHSFK